MPSTWAMVAAVSVMVTGDAMVCPGLMPGPEMIQGIVISSG